MGAAGPWGAFALLALSILIPAVFGYLGKRAAPPADSSGGGPVTPAPPLPAAVEGGVDIAKRYFDRLEDRADHAEAKVAELTALLEQERRRSSEMQLRWQRDLDAAQFEITQLREQVRLLTWRDRGS